MQMYNNSLRFVVFWLSFPALCALSLFAQSPRPILPPTEMYHAVRIELSQQFSLKDCEANGIEIEHVQTCCQGQAIEVIASHATVESLRSRGVTVTIVQEDMQTWLASEIAADAANSTKNQNRLQSAPPSFLLGNYGNAYYRLQDIYDEFSRMASKYPTMLISKQNIGTTIEGRNIVAYRITSPTKNVKTEVLYTSLHHAREPGGAVMLIYYLWWLLDNYGKNDEATYLLNTRDFWIIPVVNPDGYAYNESINPSGGGLWRKNRRPFGNNVFGVDLNRNYGPMEYWNASNGGSSDKQEEDTYRGKAPFSEPETQAVRDFCLQHAFVIAHHYHTYGNLLIYPISATSQESPDSTVLRGLASEMTADNVYSAGRDLQTVGYAVRGDADSWMYKQEQSKNKIISLTTEAGNMSDGFWAKPARVMAQCAENLRSNLMIAWSARANVRPVMSWQSYDTTNQNTVLNIRIQNVGMAPSTETTLDVRTLNSPAQIENANYVIASLSSGQMVEYQCTVRATDIPNGRRIPVEIALLQDGVLRRDTVSIQVSCPEIVQMYKGEQSNPLWSLNGWGIVKDATLGRFILDESPNANYSSNIEHTASYQYLVDLRGVRNGSLQFTSRWNMDANYDFAVVQASTNFGVSWINLRAKRMKTGLGLSGSRQGKDVPGFAGNYPLWTTLECPLDTLLGKQFFLRFALMSDNLNNFDGWKIADASLRIYRDIPLGINDGAETHSAFFSPNPAGDMLYVYSDGESEVVMYDLLGREVLRQSLEASTIPFGQPVTISALPNGSYTVVLLSGNRMQLRQQVAVHR